MIPQFLRHPVLVYVLPTSSNLKGLANHLSFLQNLRTLTAHQRAPFAVHKLLVQATVDCWRVQKSQRTTVWVFPKIGVFPPKWMVYSGKPTKNGWFGGTTIYGNTHLDVHKPLGNNRISTTSTNLNWVSLPDFWTNQQYQKGSWVSRPNSLNPLKRFNLKICHIHRKSFDLPMCSMYIQYVPRKPKWGPIFWKIWAIKWCRFSPPKKGVS